MRIQRNVIQAMIMYLRFEIDEKDDISGREKGIFMAMDILQENDSLYSYERELEDELYSWFKKNLKVPKVQSSGSGYHARPKSISWFKSSATKHIEKMREYAQILESHGLTVKQVTTDRPGNIVYEDEHQIAAIPFNDTFK